MMRQPAYRRTNGSPSLHPSIVVYLDILGFRELIARADTRDEQEGILSQIDQAIQAASHWIKSNLIESRWPESWSVAAFTDNIVVGYPVRSPHGNGEPELGSMFWHIGMFQLELIRRGFCVRGAISVGDFWLDDRLVFGRPLIEAYDVERKWARFPRVVLAPSALRLVRSHLAWYGETRSAPQASSILKDADGVFFVDYLEEAIYFVEDEHGPDTEGLEKHKQWIEDGLALFDQQLAIRAKYEWAGRYHNWSCTTHDLPRNLLIDLPPVPGFPKRVENLDELTLGGRVQDGRETAP